ncbi:hypothetical protein F5X98DRAFT_376093 [Xylaria grammica]|nr:hypothetical protein F5X98DRAFT_376093 [Xylaria grammica]
MPPKRDNNRNTNRSVWSVGGKEEGNVLRVRVTCNFCQWGQTYNSSRMASHLDRCTPYLAWVQKRRPRHQDRKKAKVLVGQFSTWTLHKTEDDGKLTLRCTCHFCQRTLCAKGCGFHRRRCEPFLHSAKGEHLETNTTGSLDYPSGAIPQGGNIEDDVGMLIQEALDARFKRFGWTNSIRDRLVQSWHDWHRWYQEWRLRCQGKISSLEARGLFDEARKLEERLNEEVIYSDAGTFEMMWPTGFGHEVFRFVGISKPQEKQGQSLSLDIVNESGTSASSETSSDCGSDSDSDWGGDSGGDRGNIPNGQLANDSTSEVIPQQKTHFYQLQIGDSPGHKASRNCIRVVGLVIKVVIRDSHRAVVA